MPARLIRDIIKTQRVLTLASHSSVRDAARQMKVHKVGAVMVVDNGVLVGIFTERDCLFRVLADGRDPDTTELVAVMTSRPVTISSDRHLGHALHLMHDHGFRHIPVVEAGIPVGMVSVRDALGAEISNFEREVVAKAELGEILG